MGLKVNFRTFFLQTMGLKVKKKKTHFSFIKITKLYNDNVFDKFFWVYGYFTH
jgi:hypothetical protein